MSLNEIKLSTGTVPPVGSVELGLVRGSCVISTSIINDILAIIRNISVGGELTPYTRLLGEATDKAVERMCEQAFAKGAIGIYAIQFMAPQVAGGAAEVVAIGTAYKIVK